MSLTEGRLSFEAKMSQGADNESETSVLASTWRQAGRRVEWGKGDAAGSGNS